MPQTLPSCSPTDQHFQQPGVVCGLAQGALNPLTLISNEDAKQDWPQHRVLGNTTGDQPLAGCYSIHQHSLGLVNQLVFYPVKSGPVHTKGSQFFQENAAGNGVKGIESQKIRG